jgi:uncharacterized repeat protein (TIGR01451 family)
MIHLQPAEKVRRFAAARRSVVRRNLLRLEHLEDRTVPAISLLNGNGYAGLNFSQSSGGYVPPDTSGAAGPSAYLESVNQSIELFPNKAVSTGGLRDSLSHFFFTTGGLTRADSGSGLSDPVVAYDELIGRFVVGDQDVNFSTHVSAFDLAVSRTNNPTSLSAADWAFVRITTTESGYDADYPGNFGYNRDALVFTLNMFGSVGHVQVVAVNANDLMNAVATPQVARNDLADFSVRPTAMHGSAAGDPMWLVTEHGDGRSIDVVRMTGVLTTSATFAYTNLAVTSYSGVVFPKNPNGSVITNNIDSRIQKAAEANNTLVAAHAVSVSSTQDVIQWYAINVGGVTPTLAQQGRAGAGANTYAVYPGIDINSAGQIGMTYMKSGTDTSSDYLSMWVTGRVPTDAAGTMETAVLVPAGTGLANYDDFTSGNRAGDLSGINVDPVDGSFWAANEFANTLATANWGTAIANFSLSVAANATDMAVTVTGPSTVPAGGTATYTIALTNNGPNAAQGVNLTDTLPAGATLVSFSQTSGTDVFTIPTGTATASANGSIASGSSDTFSLVVTADPNAPPGTNFSDAASVSSSTTDSNTSNNSATAAGSIVGPSADIIVINSGPASAAEGDNITFTITVTNNSAGSNPATGVVLTDTLGTNLRYVSFTTGQGTVSRSGSVVTFTIGSIGVGASVTVSVTAQALEDGNLSDSGVGTATSNDPDSANNTAAAVTAVSEPPIVVSAPLTSSDRHPTNLVVATFTHAAGIEPTSAFNAVINWGDGTTSAGTITQSGTTYSVTGSHKYTGAGNSHTITTTVTEIGAATELLLGKIGDEVPDLPDQAANWNGIVHRSLNGQTNQVTHQVADFLAGNGSGQSLAGSLRALFERAKSEGQQPDLSGLIAMLRAKSPSNSRAIDTLLLIDDIWADYQS